MYMYVCHNICNVLCLKANLEMICLLLYKKITSGKNKNKCSLFQSWETVFFSNEKKYSMIGCLNIVLFKHQRYSVSLTLYKNIWVLTKYKKKSCKSFREQNMCVQ